MFPHVAFEANFYEDPDQKTDDPLWPEAETDEDVNERVENVLHRIFTEEKGKCRFYFHSR
jgi:broad specificity phosphatase PhoE